MCTSSGLPHDRHRDARGLDSVGAIRHDERMTTPTARSPYLADMEAERTGWYRFAGLVRRLEPEDRSEAGYYGKHGWSVRALTPHVGAYIEIGEENRLGVRRARAVDVNVKQGDMKAEWGALLLGCCRGALRLEVVQPPGGKPMAADAYLRGHSVPAL